MTIPSKYDASQVEGTSGTTTGCSMIIFIQHQTKENLIQL